MGRKGKAKKSASTGEGHAAEASAAAAEAPSELLAAATSLLDGLRLEEAIARLEAELLAWPSCHALAELLQEARQMRQCFEAEGVALAAEEEPGGIETTTTTCLGRRLVTLRSFKQGEVVLREKPLLVAPLQLCASGRAERAGSFAVAAVRAAHSALSSAQRRLLGAFEASMQRLPAGMTDMIVTDPSLEPLVQFARIMAINAHEYTKEPGKAALFLLVARANHSCDPVCALGSAGASGELALYALRDLDAGEEVLYSYLGGHFTLQPTHARRRQLMQAKLFECRCRRCMAPEEAAWLPCGAAGCSGFLRPASDTDADTSAAAGVWRCGSCGIEEEDSSDRIASYRRLEPLWAKKVQDLEALWHNPNKDPAKYISDWVSLAKTCGKMLGGRHYVYGRACFFALMALNTGRAVGVGGIDAARHAEGAQLFGDGLLDYLEARCPDGCRRVLLEPVAQALLLLGQAGGQQPLLAALARRAGREELRLPLLGPEATAKLQRIVTDALST